MDHIPTEDPELEEAAIAEDELIDAYVRNELTEDERKLIEKGIRNSPRLVERVRFAKMLAKAALDSKTPVMQPNPEPIKPPWWKLFMGVVELPAIRIALVACVIIVLVGGVVLLVGWMKLRSESQRFDAERTALEQQRKELEKKSTAQQSTAKDLTAELQTERVQREQDQKLIEELKRALSQNERISSPATPSTIASILLMPGLTRDVGGGNELIVSPASSRVRIQLGLESDDYPSYRAIIKNSQSVQITKNGLRPRRSRSGKILLLEFPANRLPSGDYTVRVSGITSSGDVVDVYDYALRVRTT